MLGKLKEGVKYDQQKRRFSLFPTITLYAVIDVLEYGARKYTTPISSNPCEAYVKLAEYCTCPNNTALLSATQNDATPREDFAPLATKHSIQKLSGRAVTQIASRSETIFAASATTESLKKQTLDMQNARERTTKTGNGSTVPTSRRGLSRTTGNPGSKLRHAVMGESDNSLQSGSPSKMSSGSLRSRKVFAQSAKSSPRGKSSTSTTTTPPESLGGLSAGVATKDSVSWEIVSKALHEHSSTCHARAVLSVRDCALWRSGAGNWRHLDNLRTRYYDAAQRHINDWWMGERNDSESKLPHLAHAICCLVFLLTFELEKKK